MKIPVGNFGFQVPQVSRTHVDVSGVDAVGRGLQQLGNIGMQASADMMAEQRRKEEEVARTRAVNALADHELQTALLSEDIKDKLQRGEITREAAQAGWTKGFKQITDDTLGVIPDAHKEAATGTFTRMERRYGATVAGAIDANYRQEVKAGFTGALDKLGKIAGLPNADIEKINGQADTLVQLGRMGGIPPDQVAKTVQDFKDKNWQNHATQRAMVARDDIEALKTLENDLSASDGYYAMKLDTDKRNAILRSVIGDRMRIENKQQHLAERHEARAEKTIGEIDRQIASGVPASPDMWAEWAGKVKGTAFEGDFRQRIADEAQVQDVLRMPIEQQRAFVQKKEAALLNGGGSVREKANVDRLKTAVDANVKQLQESPLLFNQNRTGEPVQPLDIAMLAEPGGASKVAETMKDRVATITALQKQYGPQVQMRPLLPQEAQFLTRALDQASPKQQAELFSTLRTAIGDDSAYTSAMQQIAPDSPVKALAGMLMAKQRKITLEKNWIADDVTASSGDVAATILEGENLLNKTKGQKAEDGKPRGNLYIPPRKDFEMQFSRFAGDAFANRPGALEVAVQAAYAYYVGKSSASGRLNVDSKDIDGSLVQQSLTATLGTPVKYGDGGTVFAPWGMSESDFKDKAKASFASEVKARGLPDSTIDQLPRLGLRNLGDGSYYVTQGRNFLYDRKGQPVVIKVQP